MNNMQSKQQGFTLLELLVVITLLAVLSVGALVAYDGVGDKAESAAAAQSIVGTDTAIRQFKAVTNAYPNQWDNLVANNGSLISALPTQLTSVVQPFTLGAAASAVTDSIINSGIDELQVWLVGDATVNTTGVVPNLAHNESFNPDNAQERNTDVVANLAVVPGFTGCQANGVALPVTTDPDGAGPLVAGGNWLQNRYSDFLEGDECHMVVALGFGSDAAASTTGASVSIGKAPSFSKSGSANPANNINPNTQYTRYIGLFLVGSGDGGTSDTNIESGEFLDKARLIALIAPDGTLVDQNLAAATRQ